MTVSDDTKPSISLGKVAAVAGAVAAIGAVAYVGYRIVRSRKANASSTDGGSKTAVKKNNLAKTPATQSLSPKDAAARLKTDGNEHFKRGEYKEAIDKYTEAIAKCPTNEHRELSTYYQNRAAAHEKMNDLQSVIDDSTSAIEHDKLYIKAYARRAKAYESQAKYDQSLIDYTSACLLENFARPQTINDADRVLKKMASIRANEIYKARDNTDSLRSVSKYFVETYLSTFCEDPILNSLGDMLDDNACGYNLARIALKEKRYNAVIDECNRELADDNSVYQLEALLLRATFALISGSSDRAAADFDQFFRHFNCLPAEKREQQTKLQVNALIKRASYHMQLGKKEECMADLAEAERILPNTADIYHHRGQLLVLLAKFTEAIDDLTKCIELRPDFASAKVQRGYARYRLAVDSKNTSDISNSILELETIVRSEPNCAEGCALLGQVYTEMQNFDDASEMYDKTLELHPADGNIYVHKGLMELQRNGENVNDDVCERAMQQFQRAIEVDACCEFAYETIGNIEVQRGNFDKAIENFQKAIDMSRTELELTNLCGLLLAAQAQVAVTKRFQPQP